MNLRKVFVPAVAVAALVLGGCSQVTDYAAFHEKAVEAVQKGHEFKSATLKVTTKTDNSSSEASYAFTFASSVWQPDEVSIASAAYAVILNGNTAASVSEDENYKYYFVGNGFMVEVSEKEAYTYESHGLIAGYASDTTTYSVSYK